MLTNQLSQIWDTWAPLSMLAQAYLYLYHWTGSCFRTCRNICQHHGAEKKAIYIEPQDLK